MLNNINAVTKCNPKELALGKAQGAAIKCLKSLPTDTSWNNVQATFRQQFSFIPTITHATTHLMHRYQKKGEGLQDLFSFELIELIQAITTIKPKDINGH